MFYCHRVNFWPTIFADCKNDKFVIRIGVKQLVTEKISVNQFLEKIIVLDGVLKADVIETNLLFQKRKLSVNNHVKYIYILAVLLR